MRKNLSLLIFLLCVTTISCDGYTKVKGFVYDDRDQPIKEALVTLKYSNQTFAVHTDKDGAYEVGLVHGPFFASLTLTAVKDGYKPYELSFSSDASPAGYHKIVLMPLSTP